jgi:hypothetical protein
MIFTRCRRRTTRVLIHHFCLHLRRARGIFRCQVSAPTLPGHHPSRFLAHAAVIVIVAGLLLPTQAGATAPHHQSGRHHKPAPSTFNGPNGREARWVINENKKPGTTSWEITVPQSTTGIMGYANMVQAEVGNHITLYVSTQAPKFDVQAFRMGYYQGKGARLIWHSHTLAGSEQPACPVTPGINMVQCSWSASLSFSITTEWVQGEYLLKLVGSGGQQSYVPLTIYDPTSQAAYVIMDPVLTNQVFNLFGGYDLYQGATPCAPNVYPCSSRSLVVSFDRPYLYGQGAGIYLSEVYPLTRLAEKDDLDVTYWTDITLATGAASLSDHNVLISAGHDEEWSLSMRNAAIAAADKGVNLIFFGASAILRKVRLQASALGPDRQIINYRDPEEDPLYGKDNAQVSQNEWGQPPADWLPSELLGANYIGYNEGAGAPLVDSNPTSWLFAGTGLAAGATIPNVLANDFQQYQPLASNPPNVEILAHSPVQVELHGSAFADTTYYTIPTSKAGIFDSGTTQWIPSLDPCPATETDCPAPMMQELTNNLLRVFGEGPVGIRYPSVANWEKFYG